MSIGDWKCHKCGHNNGILPSFCQQCGTWSKIATTGEKKTRVDISPRLAIFLKNEGRLNIVGFDERGLLTYLVRRGGIDGPGEIAAMARNMEALISERRAVNITGFLFGLFCGAFDGWLWLMMLVVWGFTIHGNSKRTERIGALGKQILELDDDAFMRFAGSEHIVFKIKDGEHKCK